MVEGVRETFWDEVTGNKRQKELASHTQSREMRVICPFVQTRRLRQGQDKGRSWAPRRGRNSQALSLRSGCVSTARESSESTLWALGERAQWGAVPGGHSVQEGAPAAEPGPEGLRGPVLGTAGSTVRAHSFPHLPTDYEQTLEQRLKLGVIISCFVIALICLSCYCSVSK